MKLTIYSFSMMAILGIGLAASAAEMRGVVVKVDQKTHELIVEGRGRGLRGTETRFKLGKESEIFAGKERAKETDLEPGKHVRIIYETKDGQRNVVRVTLRPNLLAELGKVPPANQATHANQAKSGPNDANTVSGVLRRIALTDREIVVLGPGIGSGTQRETTIFVPEAVKIAKDQKTLKLDDLKEGDQVSVQIEKDAHEIVARSIQVGAAAVSAKTSAAPPADRAEKVRRILQIVDGFLGGLDRP